MLKRQNFILLQFISALLVVFLASANSSYGQSKSRVKLDSSTFFKMQKEVLEQRAEEIKDGEETGEEDGPDELFQRWSYWMNPRMYPNGVEPDANATQKAWNQYKASHSVVPSMSKTTTWTYAGPFKAPSLGGGTGRINVLLSKPGNPKIMWAGTPDGGLWKSTDAGSSWTNLTDTIPNIGVADITLDPHHPDTMYLATGDGYGYAYTNGIFWGGSYSNGVMKSTDGGATFNTTGLNWNTTQSRQVFRVAVNPSNSAMIYAAADNGLYMSKDGGTNWTTAISDYIVDIKFDPANPAIAYASGTTFYYSTDSGKTWTNNASPFANQGYSLILLGVTPADSNLVYALAVNYTYGFLYKSTDKGLTWSYVAEQPVVTDASGKHGYYGKYAACIGVSPTDPKHLILGESLGIFESTDGGSSYNNIANVDNYNSSSYVHPDHRYIQFKPGSNDTVYNGNDGGAYMGIRNGTGNYTWKLISDGIQVLQFYGVSSSNANTKVFFGGAQDNGINRGNDSTLSWDHYTRADGMLCAVRQDKPQVVYANNQYGQLSKSTDGGNTWNFGPFNGGLQPSLFQQNNWVAPIQLDPIDFKTIYYGAWDLYKSTDEAGSWTRLKVNSSNSNNIALIAVAPSTSNYIYVVKRSDYTTNYASIYVTTNAGKSWTDISSGGLPTGAVFITDIKVDRVDSEKVWLTMGGFSSGDKVYMSKDKGAHWTNVSGTLPNVPVNCIGLEHTAENGIYVGTDIGVFYKTDSSSDWVRYSDGLPNVIVNAIEVLSSINKLRIATYGRGIWQGDIAGTLIGIEKMKVVESDINVYPNPSDGAFNISFPADKDYTPSISIYNVLGKLVYESSKTNNSSGTISINLPGLANGIYSIAFTYKDVVAYKKILINH